MRSPRILAIVLATVLLGACVSVPDKVAKPKLRHDVPLAGLSVPSHGQWPAQDWWKSFHDPQLDQLIHMAMKGSTSLSVARARVNSAQQSIHVAAAQAGLKIGGSAEFERQRLSEHGLIPTKFLGFTWYNQATAGVQLNYHFDWWGKQHDKIRAAIGAANAAQARASAAALALETSIADTYFGWQADQARLQLARQQVRVNKRLVHIDRLRLNAGLQPIDKLLEAQSRLSAARLHITSLQGSARIKRVALATLAGVAPKMLPALKARPLPAATMVLPANARLDLIARRPDIAASRWQVEAALQKVHAARAEFFPDISVTAMAGLSSIDMSKFLDSSSRVLSVAPALHLPIFEGDLLRAGYGASRARLKAAIADYDNTVSEAAHDVARRALTLQQLHAQRRQQRQQIHAVQAIARSSTARQRQGLTDARPVLRARAQLLQERDTALTLQAQAVSADIALIQSLGGGYRMPTPGDESGTKSPHSPRKDTP